jgi:two-component system, NtrC family, response regulator HydG
MSAKFWSSLDMNRQLRILVAQDDRARRESLREQIGSWGFEVEAVCTRQALEKAQTFEPDSLLTELEVQGNDGQTILHELRARGLEIATIVISKETELANAVQTIKPGAYNFLSKPINTIHLRTVLNNLKTQLIVIEKNQRLRRQLIKTGALGPIIIARASSSVSHPMSASSPPIEA